VTIRALLLLVLVGSMARADGESPYQSTVHARTRRDDQAPGTIVITARELVQRNVQNLAQALDLVPELSVRQGGMGVRLDLRGAKQRSILLLIDGIPIDEPYFGAFDLSAIPVTDIVEIRIQLAPASPLEGPGGDGGVVEVQTLRAVGNRRIQARVETGTAPEVEGALTGRVPVNAEQTSGLRLSAGGRYANPDYPVTDSSGNPQTFFNQQYQAYSALRFEHQSERGRVALDGWYGHRAFAIPPSDIEGSAIQVVTGEDAARLVLGGEAFARKLRLAVGAYGEVLARDTDFYADYTLRQRTSHQGLITARSGAAFTLERPWQRGALGATLAARLSVDGEWARIQQTGSPTSWGLSFYGAFAVGARIRWRILRAEASVGAMMPFNHVAGTWPEAKVSFGIEPNRYVALFLVGARKGRLPTVRELYDPTQGNPNLDPEQTWHGELRLELRPHPLVSSHTTAYVKQIDGFIRLDPFHDSNRKNINLDTIEVRGFEGAVDVASGRILGCGAAYLYQDAQSPTLGTAAIPNMPAHRVDAYVSSTWQRRIGALIRFRWISDRIVQGATLDPYHVVDVTVWGLLTPKVRASLRVNNLTNQHYQQLPSLRVPGTQALLTVEGVWE
jgi:outer membrane cobalamin receptor